MVSCQSYNGHKNLTFRLLNGMNTFEREYIFFCKSLAKHTNDPYILDLAFNELQSDLKEISLQQESGSHCKIE